MIETKLCTKLSYRNAADTLNLIYHKTEEDVISSRTLSDNAVRIGKDISRKFLNQTEEILKMHGFNPETGLVPEGVSLSENIVKTNSSDKKTIEHLKKIDDTIELINESREEKVNLKSNEIRLESRDNCVYIAVDDIGVKRQKDLRKSDDYEKDSRFVENTVAHIQDGSVSYSITALGMRNLFKSVIAFLLVNNLMSKEIVFLTDGAKNIKNHITEMFSFHKYDIILDWYHLKKRCQEYLSMSIKSRGKNKDNKNQCLEKILRYLWVGDVSSAVSYLENISEEKIKDKNWINALISYLERKREYIACYAVRAKLNYRNSSNSVEKANDILVANRQKHNGMAWTPNGSSSLASIEMIYHNHQENDWFYKHRIPMLIPTSVKCA